MSPSDWIALAGLAIVAAGSAVGYGALRQQVKDLERAREEDRVSIATQLVEVKGRAERAEAAAGEVKGLAQAVEHMGERFSAEVKHLAETVGMQMGHMREQMDGLKADNVNIRRDLRAPRRRTVKGDAG